LIIIDAGSGIRELGDALIANYYGQGIFSAEIFLTHTHLDHILGLPFFAPMYLPQTHLKIHGPITCEEERLKDVIGGQMSYRYFPDSLAFVMCSAIMLSRYNCASCLFRTLSVSRNFNFMVVILSLA